MFELRLTKALICIMISAYPLIAGFQNITDYNTNYLFVEHVMTMDSIFPDSTLKSRAINNPIGWKISYAMIILCELLTGILLLLGGLKLLIHSKNPVEFKKSKIWIFIGTLLGLAVWYFGFIVIGGEWFAAWQSQQWNGLNPAFRTSTFLFFTLILVAHSEQD